MTRDQNNASDQVCPACRSLRRSTDRFCDQCGERLTPRPPESIEATRAAAGDRRWRELRPALELWGIFLLIYGVFGLWSGYMSLGSPWFDVTLAVVDIIVVFSYCRRDIGRLAPLLRRSGFSGRGWLTSLGAFAAIAGFFAAYFTALEWLGVEAAGNLTSFREHGWPLWSAFVLTSLAPGCLEELAFRGQMMTRLESVLRPGDALVVQAAMFSVLHMAPVIFASHFVAGLVLGWLRRSTGSLYPGMLVHIAWNASVLGLELTSGG